MSAPSPRHEPVLVEPVLSLLLRPAPGTWVDATLGAGGHAAAILERNPEARLVGLDRDPVALGIAEERLRPWADRSILVHADFRNLADTLKKRASNGSRGSWRTSASPRCSWTTRSGGSRSGRTGPWT